MVVHLESGDEAVILEGVCRMLLQPAAVLTEPVAQAYREKYTAFGYSPQPDQWDGGGLFEVAPRKVLAWTSFTVDPTRFTFEIPDNKHRFPIFPKKCVSWSFFIIGGGV